MQKFQNLQKLKNEQKLFFFVIIFIEEESFI